MGNQTKFDDYTSDGGAFFRLRKRLQRNQESIAGNLTPSHFGLQGWTVDPGDISSATQAIAATGVQTLVACDIPFATSISKIGVHIGGTAAATPGTYSGVALYSWTVGATTMAKVKDSGADNGAAWVTNSTNKLFLPSLSAAANVSPANAGATPVLYYLSFIAAFTTMPTVYAGTATGTPLVMNGITIREAATNGVQTSFPASITLSGLTDITYRPQMAYL